MASRKNVVIHEEEFSSITILKPFSDEYLLYLYIIFEDAYGEISGELITRENLKKRLNLTDEEFEIIIKQL